MYTKFAKKFIIVLVGVLLSFSVDAQEKLSGVAVIAPSVSTSIKAREIRQTMNWIELPIKRADVVLVVVRSTLFNPLMPTYRSYCELEKDAENQLNIAGPKFHIYLYSIQDNFSVIELKHVSLDARY